ncbi:uncharacterized protein LOC117603342 isoform X2 [Osmia lignaria lignaria]|uniref:uncharacterized protein LOC117603342 isoform X2 n=1 Tax=Osmia lignaria lignaria TaxID=1437193 RepID=UPI00402B5758
MSKTANHHGNGKKSKVDDKGHNSHQEPSVNERKTRREKMYSENAINVDSDRQRKKISSLLTIDNVEDESQMDSALHGELAGKIVEHIFDQVQKNEDLKVSLGPGLYQEHKTQDTVSSDKTYRQALSNDEINHTTELLNKIMLLLNRLIFDEVQRKTCVSLSPDLTEFLDWMLDVNPRRNSIAQLPSLPLVHAVDVPTHFPKDKFLFDGSPSDEKEAEYSELREKLRLIEKLINEYKTLSEKEKTKVQSVHDYLSKQLDLLLEYVEVNEKKRSASSIGSAKGGSKMIVQYQGGMTNITNHGRSKGASMVSSAGFLADEEYFPEDGLDFFHKGRRTIRSLDKHSKAGKKQRKRGKRKKKHRERHKGGNAIDQPPHKDTLHNAIALRQKREYLDKEFRDSFDSEYEEPLIYSSMDFENAETKKRDDEAKENPEDESGRNTLIGDVVEKKLTNENMETSTKIERDTSTASTNLQLSKSSTFDQKHQMLREEEPITGKDQLEDEIILLNKRQSWKKQNEEQLEEVAFGEDMRKGLVEKELFEKLTEIDKKKNSAENARTKRKNDENNRNGNYNLSDEDKLRMLEEKINVYSDNR